MRRKHARGAREREQEPSQEAMLSRAWFAAGRAQSLWHNHPGRAASVEARAAAT